MSVVEIRSFFKILSDKTLHIFFFVVYLCKIVASSANSGIILNIFPGHFPSYHIMFKKWWRGAANGIHFKIQAYRSS